MQAPRPPSSARPPDSSDAFGLEMVGHYVGFVLRAPRRHRKLALACFLGVLTMSIVGIAILPFKYEVQATILAQRNPMMGTLTNPGINREWDAPTRAAREVVIRRENLVALCKETDFVRRYLATRSAAVRARDWLFTVLRGKERSEEVLLSSLVDTLESRLWVVVSQEGTVNIGFQWSDPEIAYSIVQAAMQSFIEARHASEIGAMGETIGILQTHATRVQAEISTIIEKIEQKERSLRIRSGPRIAPARPPPVQDEELVRLQAVLAARRRALADLEDFRQRRIAELQSQLAQQLATYAPQHPLIASTRQSIESLTAPSPQMAALRAETEQLERDVTRRGGTVTSPTTDPLQDVTAEARLRLVEATDPRLAFERTQMDLLLRRHSNLLERIEAARVEIDTAQAAFQHRYSVITPPQMPRGPIKPYEIMLLLGGVLGGLAMAFFASAAADLWGGRVVESWQVEEQLGITVLGNIRR